MTEHTAISGDLRKLRDAVLKWNPTDEYTIAAREHFLHAIELLPMTEVLAKIPGDTDTQKAWRAGISRNTWYRWVSGRIRPTKKQAVRVAELTGIPAEKFQGRR